MVNAIIQDGVIVGTSSRPTDFTTELDDNLVRNHMGKPLVVAMKDNLIEYVTMLCEITVKGLKGGYSSSEADTFSIQQVEWAAYTADNTASTPFVTSLATARGIPKAELMAKIGEKVTSIAAAIGTKQSRIDAIKACATSDEVNALDFD